jgi:hypothetical protein
MCLRLLHARPVDFDMRWVVVIRPDSNDDISESEQFAHIELLYDFVCISQPAVAHVRSRLVCQKECACPVTLCACPVTQFAHVR